MANYLSDRTKATTITTLQNMHADQEKIAMLTCYDASFAATMEASGVDSVLVGDSLGMVCQGNTSTLAVTIEQMVYHTQCVARGTSKMHIVTDMPFGTYHSPITAYENATKLIQAGAHMIKIEGGAWLTETIQFLVTRGIPVFAHIGLTPQSVHQMGGFKVQGKDMDTASNLIANALEIQNAGASLLLLEGIPANLGKEITERLDIPTIGIGAGSDCSGQILVMHDMLDVYPGKKAKFVKNFMEGNTSIQAAIQSYVTAVKEHTFPAEEHCF